MDRDSCSHNAAICVTDPNSQIAIILLKNEEFAIAVITIVQPSG